MNFFEQIALRQRVGHLCVQVTGHLATFALAAVLVVAWAVTGPLFQLSDALAGWRRRKPSTTKGGLEL